MQTFQWNPSFMTGLVEVDEQHHHLTDLSNQFGESITRPEGISAEELEVLFNNLADYTQYHFSNEEAMMVREGLLPVYIAHHREAHDAFMDEIAMPIENQAMEAIMTLRRPIRSPRVPATSAPSIMPIIA